jgi:hypothetical protein
VLVDFEKSQKLLNHTLPRNLGLATLGLATLGLATLGLATLGLATLASPEKIC